MSTTLAAVVPIDPAAEARRLLAGQRAAFARDGAPPLAHRLAALAQLDRLVRDNRDALAAAVSADFGNRAVPETQMAEFMPVLNAVAHARKHLARWMRPRRAPLAATQRPGAAWVRHQPLGVVGIIAPWNYPVQLALSPLVDALAAGNRVMLKPSELTPRTSDLLKTLVARHFAEDAVAVVVGGPDVATAFSRLNFDHLLFTGSTAIGRRVAQAAAENLVPTTLELGGKSPVIVAPDYDLARAARSIAVGKFINAGQTCIAPDYVLAPRANLRALADAILSEARAMYPTLAANPDYTAVVSDRHYRRLSDAVAAAEAGGATVLRHAEGSADAARKLAPAIVLDPPAGGVLMTEEIFGPVLPLLPYDTLDDAIAHVNAGERPLALYLMSNDRAAEARVLDRTISGGVTVNGTLLHCVIETLPFGGVGASGTGAYHGHAGFLRLSHARGVLKVGRFNGFEFLRPPYGRAARLAARVLIGR